MRSPSRLTRPWRCNWDTIVSPRHECNVSVAPARCRLCQRCVRLGQHIAAAGSCARGEAVTSNSMLEMGHKQRRRSVARLLPFGALTEHVLHWCTLASSCRKPDTCCANWSANLMEQEAWTVWAPGECITSRRTCAQWEGHQAAACGCRKTFAALASLGRRSCVAACAHLHAHPYTTFALSVAVEIRASKCAGLPVACDKPA
jgi:hypothetical protein